MIRFAFSSAAAALLGAAVLPAVSFGQGMPAFPSGPSAGDRLSPLTSVQQAQAETCERLMAVN